MPRVVLTPQAIRGVMRCQEFLAGKSPAASKRAGVAIMKHFFVLEHMPSSGRPIDDKLRELIIPFGDAGYVALYEYDTDEDCVYILAVRHQKEAGF